MKNYEVQKLGRANVTKKGFFVVSNQTGKLMAQGLATNRGAGAFITSLRMFSKETFSVWYR